MDYFSASLKSSTHLVKCNGDEGFLKSLNGSAWVNNVQKRLKFQKKGGKNLKHGVAFSVITSDNGKETMVEVNISLFLI